MNQPEIQRTQLAASAKRVLLLVLLAVAPAAGADEWVNTGTGDWFQGGNWDDGSVPTADDDATIDNGGLAIVRSAGARSNEMTVGSGDSGSLGVTSGGTLGSSSGWVLGGGEVSVSGEGSTWSTTNGLHVGRTGRGVIRIVAGGAVDNSSNIALLGETGTGHVTVGGAGSTFENLWLSVGGRLGGTGELFISVGATVRNGLSWIGGISSGALSMSGGSGMVVVNGQGAIWHNSTLEVGSSGTGTLTVENSGEVSSSRGFIGQEEDSTGTVTVNGLSSDWTMSGILIVGNGGDGTLTIRNGGTVSNGVAPVGASDGVAVVGRFHQVTGEVTVDGANSTWTINGGDLEVGHADSGTGTLTIGNGGVVNVNAGTGMLTLAAGSLGHGTLNIDGGAAGIVNAATVDGGPGTATLNFNHADTDYVFTDDGTAGGTAIAITGSTAVNQGGTGTTALTGSNTYTGDTSISDGTLLVNGSIADSTTTVNAGGTLGGTGSTGAVIVADDGTVAPGASAGTLATGALSLAGNSVLAFELDTPGGVNDLIAVNGDLVLDGVLNITDLGGFAPGTYTLLTYTGTLTDNGLALGSVPGGLVAAIDTSEAGEVKLVVEVENAALSVAKALTGNADEDASGTISLGDTLTYTVTATNDGSVTLNNVVVSDDLIIPTAGTTPCTSVAPDGICTLVGIHTVTQADVNAGEIVNIGSAVSDETAPVTAQVTTPVPQEAALTLTKTGTLNDDDGTSGPSAGDTISYVFTVDNTGNVTLTDITLNDPQITVVGGLIASLAPGASDTATFTGSYTVTQTDIDAGSFTNTAEANSNEGAGNTDSDTRSLSVVPELSIGPDAVDFGTQAVDTTSPALSATLQNTGNVDVSVDSVSAPGAPFNAAGGTCGGTPFVIAPSASCTLDFTFAPIATGAFDVSVDITSNVASSPHAVTLLGAGSIVGASATVAVPALDRRGLALLAGALGLFGWLALRRWRHRLRAR